MPRVGFEPTIPASKPAKTLFFYYFVCEAIGTAATPGILCQPRVIVKMNVEKQMECRLAGETEALRENLPQRHSKTLDHSATVTSTLEPIRRQFSRYTT
jgi:hypothetical protein